MQQNKPPNKHFKDMSAEQKKQYIRTKVVECGKRKSGQMVQAGRNRDRERKRALIRPNDHIDHVAVEEEVGTQTGAEPWVPSTPPFTSRATYIHIENTCPQGKPCLANLHLMQGLLNRWWTMPLLTRRKFC